MKKALTRIVALALCLTMLSASALAYETLDDPIPLEDLPLGVPEVQIQLNGRIIELAYGVAPYFDSQANRIHVPLRDVFEQLGAKVEYEAATRKITAAWETLVVTVYQDGLEAHVTYVSPLNEITVIHELDEAPITVDGRVLVPVQFVKDALGLRMGWDQANQTIVLLDINRLELEGEEPSFELMHGVQNLIALDFNRAATRMLYTVDVTYTDYKDSAGVEISLAGEVDILVDGAGSFQADVAIDATAADGRDASAYKANMAVLSDNILKTAYVQSGDLNTAFGIPADAWIDLGGPLSIGEYLGSAGLDVAQIAGMLEELEDYSGYPSDRIEIISHYADTLGLDSVDAFGEIMAAAALEVAQSSDDAFEKSGDKYTAVLWDETDENEVHLKSVVEVAVDAEGRVVMCTTTSNTTYQGTTYYTVVTIEKNKITISGKDMGIQSLVTATLEDSATELLIAPPEGSQIFDLTELNGGLSLFPIQTYPLPY